MPTRGTDITAQLESIGANVRRLRTRVGVGLTQEKLAEKAGLDYAWLRKLERGKVDLRIQTLVRIANALAVKPGVLLRAAKLEEAKPGRPRNRPRRGTRMS
jgi:transcriptional regulator with XRE-family HTH domain